MAAAGAAPSASGILYSQPDFKLSGEQGMRRAEAVAKQKNLLKATCRFLAFYRRVPKPGPVGQMRAPALSGVSCPNCSTMEDLENEKQL
jgi:hypothetical protein